MDNEKTLVSESYSHVVCDEYIQMALAASLG
jgi:hypothetical protein